MGRAQMRIQNVLDAAGCARLWPSTPITRRRTITSDAPSNNWVNTSALSLTVVRRSLSPKLVNSYLVLSNLCLRRDDGAKAAFHLKQVYEDPKMAAPTKV